MNVTEFLRPSVANDISKMNNCMNEWQKNWIEWVDLTMHKEHYVVYSSDFVLRVVLVLFCLFAVLVYIFVFSIVCESNEMEWLQLS